MCSFPVDETVIDILTVVVVDILNMKRQLFYAYCKN